MKRPRFLADWRTSRRVSQQSLRDFLVPCCRGAVLPYSRGRRDRREPRRELDPAASKLPGDALFQRHRQLSGSETVHCVSLSQRPPKPICTSWRRWRRVGLSGQSKMSLWRRPLGIGNASTALMRRSNIARVHMSRVRRPVRRVSMANGPSTADLLDRSSVRGRFCSHLRLEHCCRTPRTRSWTGRRAWRGSRDDNIFSEPRGDRADNIRWAGGRDAGDAHRTKSAENAYRRLWGGLVGA